jgi:hypothetical protein
MLITLSKGLLILEGVVLSYLSLLGILIIFGSALPFISGSSSVEDFSGFITSLLTFLFLIAGWRVYFWAILSDKGTRKKISKYWFLASGTAMILSISSFLFHKLTSNNSGAGIWYMQSQVFMPGIYFLPTATHILLHIFFEDKTRRVRRSEKAKPPSDNYLD